MPTQQAVAGISKAIVTVSHDSENDWHIFTSPQIPGFFLTGQDEDLQALYEAIPSIIEELARADFGIDVTVSPAGTFASYQDILSPAHNPSTGVYWIKLLEPGG